MRVGKDEVIVQDLLYEEGVEVEVVNKVNSTYGCRFASTLSKQNNSLTLADVLRETKELLLSSRMQFGGID